MKSQHTFTKLLLSASILAMAPSVFAQDSDPDEVIATGIRQTPVSYTHLTLPTKA